MLRFLVGRYGQRADFGGRKARDPIDYPDVGLYHPDLPGTRITTDPAEIKGPRGRHRHGRPADDALPISSPPTAPTMMR